MAKAGCIYRRGTQQLTAKLNNEKLHDGPIVFTDESNYRVNSRAGMRLNMQTLSMSCSAYIISLTILIN